MSTVETDTVGEIAHPARVVPTQYPAGTMRKLAAAIASCGNIQKRGRNQAQRYDYVTDDDVTREVRRALLENGLVVLPTVVDVQGNYIRNTNKQGQQYETYQTLVVMDFQIVDTETGDALPPARVYGTSASPGDKQVYIAITNVSKYWMLKTMMIPTGDDAEGAPEPIEPAFRPQPQSAQPAAKPKPVVAPDPAPYAETTADDDENEPLTQAQIDGLYGIVVDSGVDPNAFKRMLTQYYKVDRLANLTQSQARHVMEEFQDESFVARVERQYGEQPVASSADESAPSSILDELIADGIEFDQAKALVQDLITCTDIGDLVKLFTHKREQFGGDHPVTKRVQAEIRRATEQGM